MGKVFIGNTKFSIKINGSSFILANTNEVIPEEAKTNWFTISNVVWDNGNGQLTGHISFTNIDENLKNMLWSGGLCLAINRSSGKLMYHRERKVKRSKIERGNYWSIGSTGLDAFLNSKEEDFTLNIPELHSHIRKIAKTSEAWMDVELTMIYLGPVYEWESPNSWWINGPENYVPISLTGLKHTYIYQIESDESDWSLPIADIGRADLMILEE